MACAPMEEGDLRKRIAAIQQDQTLSDAEKAKKRQELLSGRWKQAAPEPDKGTASAGMSLSFAPCLHKR